jgi:hypothetical protein
VLERGNLYCTLGSCVTYIPSAKFLGFQNRVRMEDIILKVKRKKDEKKKEIKKGNLK